MITPKTRWHKFVEAIHEGRIALTTGNDGPLRPAKEYAEFDYGSLLEIVDLIDKPGVVKYYVEPSAMDLVTGKKARDTVSAMVKAGVATRLPHVVMVMEWEDKGKTLFVLISMRSEDQYTPSEEMFHPFRIELFELVKHKTLNYEAAVVHPIIFFGAIYTDETDHTRIHFAGTTPSFIKDSKRMNEWAKKMSEYLIHWVDISLTSVIALLNTRGIASDVVSCEKLNVARKKSGKKVMVPDTRVIRVGTVYDRAGRGHDVSTPSGRKMPVHWRSAHNRRVAVGEGRKDRKWIHVKACLVNYEGGETPAFKDVVVRR